MLTVTVLVTSLHIAPRDVPRLAARIGRTEDDVLAWLDGSAQAPPYLELTCRAVDIRCNPATVERMAAHPDLSLALSVPPDQVRYWHKTQQYPIAARLAVAALDKAVPELSQHDVRILGQIIRAGRYYRRPGAWAARPVMGKPMPKIRLKSIDRLRRNGYVTVIGDTLTATGKGRDKWFIR